MAERYQRCFTLPVNLYAPGAPVLIAAGALLLDTQTNGVLAQLKLQNLGAKPIKSVKVAVSPLDPAGRALGEPVAYQYLDLSVARDEMFGQKVPIRLPDASARSFTAAVTEVIFSDNTIWSADAAAAWAPLAEPKPLRDALGDMELVKQYQLRYGADAIVQPERIGDLWRCACGALNREEEAACHACRKAKAALLDTDLSALEREKDARLEQEREAAEKRKAAAEAAAKKTKKILAIAIPALIAVIVAALVVTKNIIPNVRYNKAVALMEAGKYDEAVEAFEAMDGYKDSADKLAVSKAELLAQEGKTGQAALAYYAMRDTDPAFLARSFELWREAQPYQTIAAGGKFSVGVRDDGTAVAVGCNEFGQCNISSWKNIVSVCAGESHTVGLCADGTVISAGSNKQRQCNVSDWANIVSVSAGQEHTVGLRVDGTVVAAGSNKHGQCDVSGWTDIVAICAGDFHTVGLRADGTVVATGYNWNEQCDVSDWTDIVAIAAGGFHTIGLRADGTVISTGHNDYGQCDVSGWTDIVSVSAGLFHTIGLRADGTAVSVGWNRSNSCVVFRWEDIVAVSGGRQHTIGLRSDGSVVAVGNNEDGQCDVDGWTDIKLPSDK